jgi:sec-independent protein translocase protein TatA
MNYTEIQLPVALLGNLGPLEIFLILMIVLLLFGAKKLPELARSLGKSVGEFKKGKEEGAQPDPAKSTEPKKPEPPAKA